MWESRTRGVASSVRNRLSGSGLRQSVPAALPNSRRFLQSRNIAADILIRVKAATVEAKVMPETDEGKDARSEGTRSIGEILEDLRKAEGLLFKQVVRGTNVSERTLHAIQADRLLPSPEFDDRVARMFGRHEVLIREYGKAVAKARSESVCAVKSA